MKSSDRKQYWLRAAKNFSLLQSYKKLSHKRQSIFFFVEIMCGVRWHRNINVSNRLHIAMSQRKTGELKKKEKQTQKHDKIEPGDTRKKNNDDAFWKEFPMERLSWKYYTVENPGLDKQYIYKKPLYLKIVIKKKKCCVRFQRNL